MLLLLEGVGELAKSIIKNATYIKKIIFSVFNKNEESDKNRIIAKDVETYLNAILIISIMFFIVIVH